MELGDERLRDGGGDLHVAGRIDRDDGHGGGDVGVLRGREGGDGARDGREDVAVAVDVDEGALELLEGALGVLHADPKLAQGGVGRGAGVVAGELGVVHLQLGGGADGEERLGVRDVLLRQGELLLEHGGLVGIALLRGLIAHPGGLIAGPGRGHVEGADDLPGDDGVADLDGHVGAAGGDGDEDRLLVAGGDLAGDAVLRGDGAARDGGGLAGDGVRLSGRFLLAAGGEGEEQAEGGGEDQDAFLHVAGASLLVDVVDWVPVAGHRGPS